MSDVGRKTTTEWTFRGQRPRGRLEHRLADLAKRQHGVVSLGQLRSLGMSPSAVRSRASAGRLHRLYRGVYAVGHSVLRAEGHWLAAVFACGQGATLSHRSAAALWGLRATSSAQVDVTVSRTGRRGHPGVLLHRSGTLAAADKAAVNGIPVTAVARTLLDLAEVVDRRALERAFDQAEILRILDMRALDEVMRRSSGRRGLHSLNALLSSLDPQSKDTRFDLERRFLTLCKQAGLPRPLVNTHLLLEGTYLEVDFHWPAQRLIAETDGYATHGTRLAFRRDRRRDQLLLRAGYRWVRFTWDDVNSRPSWVVETARCGLASHLTGPPPA